LAIPKALVKTEEECFVFTNRTANGRAKLILLQRLSLTCEVKVIGGVDRVIAQELPHRAVNCVRSRASYDVGSRSQAVAELGIRVVSENSEFSDRIDRRFKHKSAVHAIEVVGAVDQKIIGLRSLPVDGVGLAIAERTTSFGQAGGKRNYSGLQQPELAEISAV